MGLISGILMGILFGVSLMAGWLQMMKYRSNKRISKAIDIRTLGSLSRDDLRKICGDNYPEWISFPVFEQVKWLNKQLSKLWPFVAEAASAVIKESVEPILEDYRPPGVNSLKFAKLSLGTVAPKIEGIRVQSFKKGQVTMDIDFRWGGDPNIVLDIDTPVASIPIQFKDFQFFSVVRVIFQLTVEMPCISALLVALLSEPKPRIDYTLKAVGGSLTGLPGISDIMDDIVESIVTDTLQWPHRIVVPLGTEVDTSEFELKPEGRLTVTVVKANDLKNMEVIGKSDPYVVVHISPRFKYKTKVVDNNLNPVWNQTFELIAEDRETQSLTVEVFDEDIGQDGRLGIAKLRLSELEPEQPKEVNLRLLASLDTLKVKDKKDRGTCALKLSYHLFSKEEQTDALEEEKRILEARKELKEAGIIQSTTAAVDATVTTPGGPGSASGRMKGSVGSGLSKAGKFMGRTLTGQSSRRSE
ncbi:calcium-dependent lipid-binding protein, Synaptotagmin 7 [Hibiscus trionum]|uniref:Calcium-dependent lipid-binding protein, Synaptotagmin 7 n=1 Tax=Hibiscus trionum TaxID=183268 RepID=A0A9W7LMT1_HIBTR|nr:calcium-dependent lipid-binding protein, Synaptotagmin 7 [Hibiscus trionum]